MVKRICTFLDTCSHYSTTGYLIVLNNSTIGKDLHHQLVIAAEYNANLFTSERLWFILAFSISNFSYEPVTQMSFEAFLFNQTKIQEGVPLVASAKQNAHLEDLGFDSDQIISFLQTY